MKERDRAIDLLKGVAIYLVVLGHINPPQSVVNLIYSFHMPLFMFLSGCTFWYSFKRRRELQDSRKMLLGYLLSRAQRLLLPYVMWAIILEIVYNRSFNPITAVFNGFDRLWFLPTVFIIIAVATVAEFAASRTNRVGGGI